MTPSEKELLSRMQRMESRMVRGFSELGVRVTDDDEWFKFNPETNDILLKSPGKSMAAIWIAMRAAGCRKGITYRVKVQGEMVGTITLPEEK